LGGHGYYIVLAIANFGLCLGIGGKCNLLWLAEAPRPPAGDKLTNPRNYRIRPNAFGLNLLLAIP